jgi:hypothetical protein
VIRRIRGRVKYYCEGCGSADIHGLNGRSWIYTEHWRWGLLACSFAAWCKKCWVTVRPTWESYRGRPDGYVDLSLLGERAGPIGAIWIGGGC